MGTEPMDSNYYDKWSNNSDERLHRRLVTPRHGKWIRQPFLYLTDGSLGPHE